MKYPYWFEFIDDGICELCKQETSILTDAIDCIWGGTDCDYGYEGFNQICEKCLESKVEFHLSEFHNSVDLI